MCNSSLPFTLDAGPLIKNLELVSYEDTIENVKNYMILESLEQAHNTAQRIVHILLPQESDPSKP